MSFTSVTVTGTIINPQSNPVAGVLVQFTLSQAMTDGVTQIAPQTISTTTATNGTFSVALVANDDPTTTPAGTYYKVLIGEPNNTQNFNVVVPHASAPTVDLFQLIPYSSSAFVLAPSVTKLQAGTGITLSPASGQGIVTVTSTVQASSTIIGTTQTGATYTFALTDAGMVVEGNSATAQTFTIPPNATIAFPIGAVIEVFQYGTGQITIASGVGVTLRSDGGRVNTATQYATIGLRQRAQNEWVLSGDLV